MLHMCLITTHSLCVSAWGMEQPSSWNLPTACKGHLLTFHWKQQTTCQISVWIPAWIQEHKTLRTHQYTQTETSLPHLHSFQLPKLLTAFMMLPLIIRAFLILHGKSFSCYFQWPKWTWLCHTDLFCFHVNTQIFLFKFSASPFLQLWLLRSFQLQLNLVFHQPIFPLKTIFTSHLKNNSPKWPSEPHSKALWRTWVYLQRELLLKTS